MTTIICTLILFAPYPIAMCMSARDGHKLYKTEKRIQGELNNDSN